MEIQKTILILPVQESKDPKWARRKSMRRGQEG